jgi:hypothetical protein
LVDCPRILQAAGGIRRCWWTPCQPSTRS